MATYRLTVEKFANDVLPLMLADMAQGKKPGLPVTKPEALDPPAQAQAPAPAQVSNPNAAANTPMPQGPTAANSPAVPAPVPVEPHTLGPQQKAASFNVNVGQISEPTAALTASAKKVLGAVLRKVTMPAPVKLRGHEEEKEAGLAQVASALGKGAVRFGRGTVNFGRGAYAVTKPVTGLLRKGLPGAAEGTADAAKTLWKGGLPSLLGAGAVLSSVQSPVVSYGDGFKIRSPIAPPPTRLRSPIQRASDGVRFQTPFVR